MDEPRQVVGGVIPDQEDSGGNFAQTDPGGGLGDRPIVRPYLEPSGTDAPGGPAAADAIAAGSQGSEMEPGRDADATPTEPDRPAAPGSLPPDVTGE